jgi:hypothetical protein
MTIVPMIWAVRATRRRSRPAPDSADLAIGVFLAHVVSLFNATEPGILANRSVIWRQLAACAFFFCIFMFVNDEVAPPTRKDRLRHVRAGLLTAVIELSFRGARSSG